MLCVFGPEGPLLCRACSSDRSRGDEEGSCRPTLRHQRENTEEDGGGGQSSWTHPILCKETDNNKNVQTFRLTICLVSQINMCISGFLQL